MINNKLQSRKCSKEYNNDFFVNRLNDNKSYKKIINNKQRAIIMPRHERQLAEHRANWTRALKFSKCPKCGGKILEIDMPDVVCGQCSTKYTLAIQVGWTIKSQLIEQQNEEKIFTKEREVIVKVRCPYCKGLFDETLNSCPNCGAHV